MPVTDLDFSGFPVDFRSEVRKELRLTILPLRDSRGFVLEIPVVKVVLVGSESSAHDATP
jgi:hypothetical protein